MGSILRAIDGGKSAQTSAAAAEQALVARAKAGDAAAFATLFERYHRQMTATCRRMVKTDELEDVVQQVFLEAWRCLHRFEGRSKFSTWLTRIAINVSLGWRRKLARLVSRFDPAQDDDVSDAMWADAVPDAHTTAKQREQQAAIDRVLDQLTVKKRLVLVLADMQGYTAPEIADMLDVPPATVRTRLFHARRAFAAAAEAEPALMAWLSGEVEA